jgi:RNA polymerase subunit RPABC4/transcription elongation factor Spt4
MTYFFIALVCALVCSVIAGSRGRSAGLYFLMGLLLGPIGLLLALVTPANTKTLEKTALQSGGMRKCPMCAELVRAEAVKCKHCSSELAPIATQSELEIQREFCRLCGKTYNFGMITCPHCGN